MRTFREWALLIFMLAVVSCTSGCVGIVVPNGDYAEIGVSLRNKAEARAALGEPARREEAGGGETWYYRRSYLEGLAGNGVTETTSALFMLLLPLWYTTEYDANAKLVFHGDSLHAAFERQEIEHGFVCGLYLAHGINPVCDTMGEPLPAPVTTATLKPADGHSDCTCPADYLYPLRELPETCATLPKTSEDAACLAKQFLLAQTEPDSVYGVKVEYGSVFYTVTPVYQPSAAHKPFRSLRVNQHSGIVAARKHL